MSHIDGVPEDKRTDEAVIVAADADHYSALSATAATEGGQIVVAALQSDMESIIAAIEFGFDTMPEAQLRAKCAELKSKRSIVRLFTNARANLDGALENLRELTA